MKSYWLCGTNCATTCFTLYTWHCILDITLTGRLALLGPEKKYIMFWLSDQLTWRVEVDGMNSRASAV